MPEVKSIRGKQYANQQWRQYAKVWRACIKANVTMPQEIHNFFGGEDPDKDDAGLWVNIDDAYRWHSPTKSWVIDVRKLPNNVIFLIIEEK